MNTRSAPSALVTEKGRRVLLRIHGRQYGLAHLELRQLLGLPDGPAGVGITIDGDRLRFDFIDDQSIKISAAQLHRRLAKRSARRQTA